MKKSIVLFVLLVCAAAVLVLTTCASSSAVSASSGAAKAAPAQVAAAAPAKSSYFTGDGGKGMSIAILAPKGTGIAENQNYLPTLVQGELVSNFSGFSAISVLDRVSLDDQYAELLSGYYDDDAKAGHDLGHLAPTEYIMGGDITKTAAGYALQMRITKTADKMTAASYSGTCTFAELDNLSGIRRASLDLLEKMGVTLTERTKTELAGAATQQSVNAQTSLAQGITAQRSGDEFSAWTNFFEARTFDSNLIEATTRIASASASGVLASTNTGTGLRDQYQSQIQQVRENIQSEKNGKKQWKNC
jgi:hypothetical protein